MAHRNAKRRVFDFLWMLHTMDHVAQEASSYDRLDSRGTTPGRSAMTRESGDKWSGDSGLRGHLKLLLSTPQERASVGMAGPPIWM